VFFPTKHMAEFFQLYSQHFLNSKTSLAFKS